jgi:hypothetical protein
MKTIPVLALAATLGISFYTIGCETSHTESNTPNLIGGGTTHEETTTTHNPITNTDDKTQTETKTQ